MDVNRGAIVSTGDVLATRSQHVTAREIIGPDMGLRSVGAREFRAMANWLADRADSLHGPDANIRYTIGIDGPMDLSARLPEAQRRIAENTWRRVRAREDEDEEDGQEGDKGKKRKRRNGGTETTR